MEFQNKADIQSAKLIAKVIRADGTVEDLGEVSYYHKSWWKRFLWRTKSIVRKLKTRFG